MSELWRWMGFPSDDAVRARPDRAPWLIKEQTGWIHMVIPILPRPPWRLPHLRSQHLDRLHIVSQYRTIYLDPPWPEYGGGKSKRGADRHYPLMSVRKIKALPIAKIADPVGCHLWLWATGNYLAAAVECVQAWGFRLVNFRPWVKASYMITPDDGGVRVIGRTVERKDGAVAIALPQNPGLGQYMRCDAEILLFAVKGKTQRTGYKPRQTIYAPRGAHSAKPASVREDIERMSPAPRVELFARSRHPGWDAWGNEVESDDVMGDYQ